MAKKIISINKKRKTAENRTAPDVISRGAGKSWIYSDKVKEHFFSPKNFLQTGEENKFDFNGIGMVGSPACGDMMKFWVKIDPKTDRIKICKWQTFGCASAIASTSMLSVIVTEKGGMKIDDAMKIKPQDIL